MFNSFLKGNLSISYLLSNHICKNQIWYEITHKGLYAIKHQPTNQPFNSENF